MKPSKDSLLFTPGPLTTGASIKQAMLKDLDQIVEWAAQLYNLPEDEEDDMSLVNMSTVRNRLRQDISTPALSTQEALKNSPHHDSNYFRVPCYIKNNTPNKVKT